jgi:hypothetical protein
MSKISTVYDYYVTQLASLFSSKTRIPNPYSLEDNQSYDFSVVFCAEVIRMEHNDTAFDTVVKQLNEDVFVLREDFYDIDNNNANIDQISLSSTDPVGFFVSGKSNYLFIETLITTRISEIY